MLLKPGKTYDTKQLKFIGWYDPEKIGDEGYNYLDFFENGIYLGPDFFKVEPEFEGEKP